MREPDPRLLDEIMTAFDIPDELRCYIVAPDPDRERRLLAEQRYVKSLPRRQRDAAEAATRRYADSLPEGARFGWT